MESSHHECWEPCGPDCPTHQFYVWECLITEFDDNSVFVDMHDLTNRDYPHEVGEMPRKLFTGIDQATNPETDQVHDLICKGSVFYLFVHQTDEKVEPQIRFRVQFWTQGQLEEIKQESHKLWLRINGKDVDQIENLT